MTEQTEVSNVEESVAPEMDPNAAPVSLSLQELGTLLQIVDLAVQRGAFRGAEASQVGAVFDRLNAFLTSVREQQEAAQAAAEEGQADAEAEAPAEGE